MRRAPYELALESRVAGTPRTYRFKTADGVHSKRSFRSAERQLLEVLWERPLGELLCPEANYGVVGTVLAGRAASVLMTESSARAARLCERNARENGADASATLAADVSETGDGFDTAACAPKPYTPIPVGKRRIADALDALRPGGKLYLAAPEQGGIKRYRACLRETTGSVERAGTFGDGRVLEATRPETFDPPTYLTPRRLQPSVDGIELSLVSVPGLFAANELDDGTRLLAESAEIADGERVLDLCCGYGALGAYAARRADCEVWLSDDDRVATRCAECTLDATGVEGTVVTADCTDGVAERTFDTVLCNPPTHAGEDVLAELLAGAHRVLASDGALLVVHHRSLDLRESLAPFERVETHQRSAEHVVVRALP